MFSLIFLFFMCFHPRISTKKSKDTITVTVKNNNNTYEREILIGSVFSDLDMVSDLVSDDYVLKDGDILEIVHTDKAKISINNGDIDDLISLPGIGPVIASRIIEYRTMYGLFERIEEIKLVSGIGDKKYEKIKEFIIL